MPTNATWATSSTLPTLSSPTSSLTGCVPELRPVRNWYFDLPNFREQLGEIAENLEADPEVRPVVSQTAKEFLVPPIIYIKNELVGRLPRYRVEIACA